MVQNYRETNMKILYQIPSLYTIYAGRTIYNGYRNAFLELGHEFRPFTADDNFAELMETFQPDIFITASHFYYQRYLDQTLLDHFRKNGMMVFVWLDPWTTGLNRTRVNEAGSLKNNAWAIKLIQEGRLGDAFLITYEHGDARMEGFEVETGATYHTVPLAADHTLMYPDYDMQFCADISYIGTYLPQKRDFFRQQVFPLAERWNLRLYGQDWTMQSRIQGWIQKFGQYFNIPGLRSFNKSKLMLDDERKIYTSSTISINIHEDYQRQYGGDCNERTFKIPLAGGFEITDDVACIRKYFKPGEEIVIAESVADWFEKIDYYMRHPDERVSIIEAGRKRVLAEHTYVHRVRQLLDIYNSGKAKH